MEDLAVTMETHHWAPLEHKMISRADSLEADLRHLLRDLGTLAGR